MQAVAMSARRILMTAPTHFRVAYAINPWMNASIQVDSARAHKQWSDLRATLRRCGAEVAVCDATADTAHCPDIVFCANAAVVRGNVAYMAKMYNAERRGESPHFTRWFANNGYTVVEEDEHPFEGAAEADFMDALGRPLMIGSYGQRTAAGVFDRLHDVLSGKECGGPFESVLLRLVSPKFYHLDTCFCPIDAETALIYEPAFDADSLAAVGKQLRLIAVRPVNADAFACNSVVVPEVDENANRRLHVVMPAGNEAVAEEVERLVRHATVHLVDVDEFIKAGGAAKCMTLRI